MNLFDYLDERIKQFTVWDVAILKICVLAFTLMIAKLVPAILSLNWKVYGLVFIVTYIPLVYKVYIKK